MKFLHQSLRLFGAAVICLILTPGSAHSAEALQIRIHPASTFQKIDGFGASDAWQCQFVGKNWPVEKRERIADLLFSRETDTNGTPKGIGLSIWRFNLGAGTAEQGDASGIANPWRRAECFQNADGSYDWTKQAGQQWFLKAAHSHGVEKLLLFPNAAPVHLARNDKGYPSKETKDLPYLNIKPGKMGDYALFMADVVEHFQKEGLAFDYLSPFNEPQWAWDEAEQEGTPALNTELYALIRYLSHELSQRKLPTQLAIGEAGTIGHAFMSMDKMGLKSDGRDSQAQFFFAENSPFYIGGLPNVAPLISAHDYHSVWPLEKQVEFRQMLHAALTATNPKLGYWQSEYCILEDSNPEIGNGNGRDLGMNTALYIARLIHHDLTIAHARSWQWWTAVSEVDYKDGLVYLDDGSKGETGQMGPQTKSLMSDGTVRESKLLWALGNYSRFIRPGATRIDCQIDPQQSFVDGLLASAYKTEQGQIVTVFVNLSKDDKRCNLGSSASVDTYTTSAKANLAHNRQNASEVSVPSRSIVTILQGTATKEK